MKTNTIKSILLTAALLLSIQMWAYDFSAVCSTGQTLYYNIHGTNVTVTYAASPQTPYSGYTEPAGNLVIPSSVTYNGTVYNVTEIGLCAFMGCPELVSVTINAPVSCINASAFQNCTDLDSIVLPATVTQIGNHAFQNTRWYNSQPEGLVYIGDWLIRYKGSAPAALTVATGTKHIADYAFNNCSATSSITLPDSLVSIGVMAFGNCAFSSITIPGSVTLIEHYAFSGSLWENNQPDGILYLGEWCLGYKVASPTGNLTINAGTKKIANSAFQDCMGLLSVTLPSSMQYIGSKAFFNCNVMSSLVLGDSLISIGSSAFEGCQQLHSITIPASLTALGSCAFCSCPGLNTIVVDSGNTVYDSRNNCKAIIETATNTLVLGCSTTVIPNTVTSIAPYAFDNCYNLINLNIPNSVVSIGAYAFNHCYGLTSVTIPNTVVSLGDCVFSNCTWLKNLSIGNSITVLKKSYFESCNRLENITLAPDNSLVSIEAKTFNSTAWFSSQPAGIVYLGNWCLGYRGNKPSGNKTIKEGTRGIADETFKQCTGLQSLTMPNTMEVISYNAFDGCTGLNTLKIKAPVPPTVYDNTFGSVSSTIHIIVPCESAAAYQSAQYWSSFTNFTEELMYTLVCKSNHTWLGSVEVLTAPTCATFGEAQIQAVPISDAYFARWSDSVTDNPRTLTVTQDTTMIAIFESLTGVNENDTPETVLVSSKGKCVTIVGAEGLNVQLFDTEGRTVFSTGKAENRIAVNVPAQSVYVVKIGEYKARKIVITE